MKRKYKKPPIVEALCEFQFIPQEPYNLTIPGLFYDKIKEEFPIRQEQSGLSFNLLQMIKGDVEVPILPKIQFSKPGGTPLVQLAPDLLVVNCLKHYPSWEGFKPLILKYLEVYKEVGNPKGIKKAGLRYINVIEFDTTDINLEDYFYYYPVIPNGLPQKPGSFLSKVEIPFDDERLMLTLGTIVAKKINPFSITLDIEYAISTPGKIAFNNISEWLDKAHNKVEDAFELCITDNSRELFQEEK